MTKISFKWKCRKCGTEPSKLVKWSSKNLCSKCAKILRLTNCKNQGANGI